MVKIKNRYALVEVLSEAEEDGRVQFTSTHLYHEIIQRICALHGDVGAGAVRHSFLVKVVDGDVVVLRLPSELNHLLLSSLPFVRFVNKQPVALRLIFSGRSIRSCEMRLLKMRRKELHSVLSSTTAPEERAAILKKIHS